jgi:hypothetical protein
VIEPARAGTGQTELVPDAPPIMSNVPGSFAWGVLHQRHPALIGQVRAVFPYPADLHRGLDRLLEEITGTIEPLGHQVHDRQAWEAWGRDYLGQRWPDVRFLWAESYFYRKLLEAVGFFEPGPWRGVDPFEPFKRAELDDPSVDADLAALHELASLEPAEHAAALVQASLWGNRADLGFRISAAGAQAGRVAELVADDSPIMWSLLDTPRPGTVCVVADNAGRELLPDLVLIDHLLETTGRAARVALHLKPYPYYVSDATTADVIDCLRRLVNASGRAAEVGRRLWVAVGTGRLAIRTHPFYCAPLTYHHLPADLAHEFATASMTILKGDLNYRRLVGDCEWPPTTPYATLSAYWPSPLAVLRTLKSDVIVGITSERLSTLDSTSEPWRTNGTRALIQARA